MLVGRPRWAGEVWKQGPPPRPAFAPRGSWGRGLVRGREPDLLKVLWLPSGEQAADHEEGRDPDQESEDVHQVQEEQERCRVLRGAVQVHAGEGLPLQRRCPGWTHGARGPSPTLQPLGTHLAHPNAHPPLLQPLLWPPPPIQHGDRHGLGRAPQKRTDRCQGGWLTAQGWAPLSRVGRTLSGLPFPED